jgi:hypothetical protein
VEVIGGVFNDAFGGSPAAGQASVLRITAQRAAHVNLRRVDGTEIGTSTTPLVVVGNTGGNLPIQGTVAATQSGSNWSVNVAQVGGANVATAAAGVQQVAVVGSGGTAISQQAPLQVQNAPSGGTGGATQTAWRNSVNLTGTTTITGTVLRTPTGGQRWYLEGLVLVLAGAAAGTYLVTIYDGTNAAANILWSGVAPAGVYTVIPSRPIPAGAINNLLKVDVVAGTGAQNCWITAWGYDA